ncbi:MAG TPA: FAD-dependent oxidoreductase [Nitrolancea sp.]|nr:FAD-dependent oxidoreductase [Nitrolancea sp.]
MSRSRTIVAQNVASPTSTKQVATTNSADSSPRLPVILIVDAEPHARQETVTALVRRFGADYRIVDVASAESGFAVLQRLAGDGEAVALVAVDLRLPGSGGVAFLERARGLHPGAGRMVLIGMGRRGNRIPIDEMDVLHHASVLGHIDSWVMTGWVSPEEWFFPRVQSALTTWASANQPHHETLRVVGNEWSPRSHEMRDSLARNTVLFGFYDADSDAGRQLLRDYEVDPQRLPAVILFDGTVLHDPSFAEVAEALGVQTRSPSDVFDLAILGAGPAGLSAAVNAASEGLKTIVIEPHAIGGQAGTSSMIRNYLGFPWGVSGGQLTLRAFEQSLLFGSKFVFMQNAARLDVGHPHHVITLTDGSQTVARAIIIATGVEYRRLDIPALDRLIGAGVFYGAPGVEAPAMSGKEVYVVGGANSAGQAAIHLSSFAAHVTVLVRGTSLAGMSNYLTTQLTSTENIDVRLHTRVIAGSGGTRLERLTLEDTLTSQHEEVAADAAFVLIGAEPHTDWLGDTVLRDTGGYILSGRDVVERFGLRNRLPLPYETSVPGVFVVGDTRHGSLKRVAGAVGEGATAVSSVHRYLSELSEHGAESQLSRTL